MAVIHSFTFTPAVNCALVVQAMAALYTRRSSGVTGDTRLFVTQSGVTTYSDPQTFPTATEINRVMAQQHRFDVVGGAACTVGLDATRPGVGGYSFSNVHIKAEQIKR